MHLDCDRCQATVDHSERGWRAYLLPAEGGRPSVEIVCPTCAERLFGEDEIEARSVPETETET
jgi:hypothetical protein